MASGASSAPPASARAREGSLPSLSLLVSARTNLDVAGAAGAAAAQGQSGAGGPDSPRGGMSRPTYHLWCDLVAASSAGSANKVRALLPYLSKDDVMQLDYRRNRATFGESALHCASSAAVVRLLLAHGCPAGLRGSGGQTVLHTTSSAEVVAVVLSAPDAPSVNARTTDGSTPLLWATVADNFEVVRALVAAGASAGARNKNGNTALHLVSSLAIAQLLVNKGAPLDVRNNDGMTPLEAAADRGEDDSQIEIAAFLLDVSHRAGVGARPQQPLRRASSSAGALPLPSWPPAFARSDTSRRAQWTGGSSISPSPLDLEPNGGAGEVRVPMYGTQSPGAPQDAAAEAARVAFGAAAGAARAGAEAAAAATPAAGGAAEAVVESGGHRLVRVTSSLGKAEKASNSHTARERWRRVRSVVLTGRARAGSRVSASERARHQLRLLEDPSLPRSSSMVSSVFPLTGDDEDEEDGDLASETTSKNDFFNRFFVLMLRDRPQLALKLLDKHRVFLYARGSDKIYSYDTSLIGGPMQSNEVLNLITKDQRYDIISNEIVQWVLNIRWVLFTREALLWEFFMHFFFVLFFMITTLWGWNDLSQCLAVAARLGQGDSLAQRADPFFAVAQLALECVLLYLNMRYILRFVVERRSTRSGVALHEQTRTPYRDILPHLGVLIEQLLRAFAVRKGGPRVYQDVASSVSAFAAITLWVHLLNFAEGFEVIGVAMATIRKMVSDISIYLLVLFVFIFGFSHATALIFRDGDNASYSGFNNSLVTLYFFVFNLDMGDLVNEPDDFRKFAGILLVGIYMLLVATVILNLVVAIMTNAFEEIQVNAKEQWLLQRAKLILIYDARENAANRIAQFVLPCVDFSRDTGAHPVLPSRNIVTEKSNGDVLMHVPAEWLHTLNLTRRWSQDFHRVRWFMFKKWKSLRRSPSFLWPSVKDTTSFFRRRAAGADDAGATAEPDSMLRKAGDELSELGESDEEAQVGAAQLPLLPPRAGTISSSTSLRTIASQPPPGSYGATTNEGLHPVAVLKKMPEWNGSSATSADHAEVDLNESRRRRGELRRFTTVENAAVRTGVDEELVFVGRFKRNPKRVAAERRETAEQSLRKTLNTRNAAGSDGSSPALLPMPSTPPLRGFRSGGGESGGDKEAADMNLITESMLALGRVMPHQVLGEGGAADLLESVKGLVERLGAVEANQRELMRRLELSPPVPPREEGRAQPNGESETISRKRPSKN